MVNLTDFSTGGGCGCKVSPEILEKILKDIRRNVLPQNIDVGLKKSDDAAVYRIDNENSIILTTDFFIPIVDNPYHFGQISATNAISDIYAMGGKPILALSILGIPTELVGVEVVRKIIDGASEVCKKANIAIAGGHTIEISQPFYGLVVLGKRNSKCIKKNENAHEKDDIILTKPIGLGLYASAYKNKKISDEEYKEFIDITTKLNKVGLEISKYKSVHAITDVTGFGLLGHLTEICLASGKSAEVFAEKVPLLKSVRKFIEQGLYSGALGRNQNYYKEKILFKCDDKSFYEKIFFDPQTSGGLLICSSKDLTDRILNILKQGQFSLSKKIGEIKKKNNYLITVS